MKRLIISIILSALIIPFATSVFANSGPVFWRGYPYSEIMAVKENSPISVENENLVFDFSNIEDSSYTISGEVTATYNMVNPTKEAQSVQMAFPFIDSMDSLKAENIRITADGNTLPYKIYPGDVVNSHGNPFQEEQKASFDFAGIVNSISTGLYEGRNFSAREKGKLYLIEVKPTSDQRINLAVGFEFDYEKTKVMTSGFNRYERNGEHTRIAAWCYEPEVLKIFVLGEDVDLKLTAYSDGELKKETDLYTYQISAEEVELQGYLKDFIKENTKGKSQGNFSDTQLYNLYAAALDEYFTRNQGYCWEDELGEQENYQRIFTLVYNVNFKESGQKEVQVGYKTTGTMDMTETVNPQYSFNYLLNPAKNWQDFKNLNIEIIAPEEAPYIIKSNINFLKGAGNIYTAALRELPEEDLSFTLYNKEKITLMDKVGKYLHNWGYFLPLIIVAIISCSVIYITVAILGKIKDYYY